MEAYRVWTTLSIKGDAQKKMQQFLKTTQLASNEVKKITKNLGLLTAIFEKMAASLKIINPEFSKFSTTMIRLNTNSTGTKNSIKGLNTTVEVSGRKMSSAANSASRLAASLNAVAVQGGLAAKSSSLMRGGAGGRRGGKGGGLMGVFGGAKTIGATGALYYGYKGLKNSYHTGMDYEKEMALLTSQNIPGINNATAEDYLSKTKVKGVSKLGMLEALNDAAVITKTSHDAFGVADTLAKMQLVGNGLGKDGFRMTKAQLQAAIKTVEIVSGSRDTKVLNDYLGMMMQTWVSTGGRVAPTQFQSVVRSARGFGQGLDPKFFFYMLEPMIQEFGTRTGPQIAGFFNHLKVGRLTTQGASLLSGLGLVDKSEITPDKVGRLIGITPNKIKGLDKDGKNIFDWIDKFLTPALEKAGYKTPQEQMGILGKIFTNTDLALVLTYLQQREKFRATAKVNEGTATIDEVLKTVYGMHSGKLEILSASFSNFSLALDKFTGPVIDRAINSLATFFDVLATGLNNLDSFLSKHPVNNAFASRSGLLPFGSATSTPDNSNAINIQLNTHLDGGVLARAFVKHMPNIVNPLVSQGTSSVNPLSSGFPTGLNNLGAQF